jgi:hypothetical protein
MHARSPTEKDSCSCPHWIVDNSNVTVGYTVGGAMGYKRIDSAIRNIAHSFVSLMNYVDDAYIIDLLPKLLRETPGHHHPSA